MNRGGIMAFRPLYLKYINYVKDTPEYPVLTFDEWLIARGIELPVERIILNPTAVVRIGEGKK
jgi:hypothetical protein